MATRINSISGSALLAALGGSISAGDTVIMKGGAEVYSSDCDLSSVELDSFHVPEAFEGQLGVPGTNVELNLVGTGGGGTYQGLLSYDARNSAGGYFEAASTIKTCNIRDTGRGRFNAAAGTWTTTDIGGGQYSALANAVLTNLYAKGLSSMLLEYNATGITTFDLLSARGIMMKRAATTSRFFDSDVRFDNRDVALATLTLYRTRLWYNGGNFTALYLLPGSVLDLRAATQAITITAGELWAGAEIIFPRGLPCTISADTLRGGGPRVYNT